MCLRISMKGGCLHIACPARLLRVFFRFKIECTKSLLIFPNLFSGITGLMR